MDALVQKLSAWTGVVFVGEFAEFIDEVNMVCQEIRRDVDLLAKLYYDGN